MALGPDAPRYDGGTATPMPCNERNAKNGREHACADVLDRGIVDFHRESCRVAVARPFQRAECLARFPHVPGTRAISHRHNGSIDTAAGAPGFTRADSCAQHSAISATQFSPEKLEKTPSNGAKDRASAIRSIGRDLEPHRRARRFDCAAPRGDGDHLLATRHKRRLTYPIRARNSASSPVPQFNSRMWSPRRKVWLATSHTASRWARPISEW